MVEIAFFRGRPKISLAQLSDLLSIGSMSRHRAPLDTPIPTRPKLPRESALLVPRVCATNATSHASCTFRWDLVTKGLCGDRWRPRPIHHRAGGHRFAD